MNKNFPSDDDVIGTIPNDERAAFFVPESLFTKPPGGREKSPSAAAPPPPAPPTNLAPPPSPGPGDRPTFAAPSPPPSPDPETPAKTPPANQSQALAETVVASFLDRLKAEARRNGGMLTLSDLENLEGEFAKKTDALQAVFEKTFEDKARHQERPAWQNPRAFPFNRLIVEKFSAMFSPDELLLDDEYAVSRRILPGFFMALNMMMGEELVEEFQQRCRVIVDRLEDGEDFEWSDLHADPEGKIVSLDAQVCIATHFEDIDKRAAWFVELINSHMAPAAGGGGAAEWQFSERGFLHFLGFLLSDLKETLSTETGRMFITKRHGVDACVTLAEILKDVESGARD
jgi:hypothetical protein